MSWGQGYVTDIGYVAHFNREVSPTWLATVCKLQNIAVPAAAPVYLELGSGQGYGLNLLAASDPSARFIGIDFNPSHIANARRVAEEAGLDNVEFREASFEHLAERPETLPDCDIVVLHGVYTWVGPEQRASLRRIVSAKLKPGGILYVSYNCMIGWGPFASLQKILRDFNLARGGGSEAVRETLQQLQRYRDAGLPYLKDNKELSAKLDAIATKDVSYLAHEFLNQHWQPMYVQDMFSDMSECKLTFVGSARPGDNFDKYSIRDEFRALVREERDVARRECLKDMARNTMFRQDIFVRGPVSEPAPLWHEALRDLAFTLSKPRADVSMMASVPRGQLQMGRPIYAQALDALASRDTALGELTPDMELAHDAAVVLMHTDWAEPAAPRPGDAQRAKRLNAVLARRATGRDAPRFWACARTGSGLLLSVQDSRILAALLRDPSLSDQQIVDAEGARSAGPVDAGPGGSPGAVVTPLTVDRLKARIALWRRLELL